MEWNLAMAKMTTTTSFVNEDDGCVNKLIYMFAFAVYKMYTTNSTRTNQIEIIRKTLMKKCMSNWLPFIFCENQLQLSVS